MGTILQLLPGAPKLARAERLAYYRRLWNQAHPFAIEQALSSKRRAFEKKIKQSLKFLDRIRSTGDAVRWLEKEPLASRLRGRFDVVCTVSDLGDNQEIQKIYLNAIAGDKVRAQDLFIKVNYLSAYEEDASIRLRFSFGEEAFKSWKAWERDRERSTWSARLAESLFPETRLITGNRALKSTLQKIIVHEIEFPERIIYSNAANGGTFFHHDYVRSHVGVIFAQLHGITGWVALPRYELTRAIRSFLTNPESKPALYRQFAGTQERAYLKSLVSDRKLLERQLESKYTGPLTELINNNPAFLGSLVRKGALRILRPGDVILLPAPSIRTATWHSVFCLDDRPGLSLSFAIKKVDQSP